MFSKIVFQVAVLCNFKLSHGTTCFSVWDQKRPTNILLYVLQQMAKFLCVMEWFHIPLFQRYPLAIDIKSCIVFQKEENAQGNKSKQEAFLYGKQMQKIANLL